MMIKKFLVNQLFRLKNNGIGVSVEIATEEKQDILNVHIDKDLLEAIWTHSGKTSMIANVEFDGLESDGITLINPIVKSLE